MQYIKLLSKLFLHWSEIKWKSTNSTPFQFFYLLVILFSKQGWNRNGENRKTFVESFYLLQYFNKTLLRKWWFALNCHIHNNPYLAADKRADVNLINLGSSQLLGKNLCQLHWKLRNSASSFHWLSSSIFNVRSFVCRPASVTPPLISTISCFRPYKPYLFC